MRTAVFGYASLASPESASRTIGRPVEFAGVARLQGWRRVWTLGREQAESEKTFARADGSIPRFCLGLNLEPDPDAPAPNGVLIELTEAELDRLDVREIRYDRVDVTAAIALESGRPGAEHVHADGPGARARRDSRHGRGARVRCSPADRRAAHLARPAAGQPGVS